MNAGGQHSPDRQGVAILAGLTVVAMGFGSVFAVLAQVQDDHGIPTWGLGCITAASFASSCMTQLVFARHADRGRSRQLLRSGLVLAALGVLWFGLAGSLWEFVGARIVLGVGEGAFVPAARRELLVRSPAHAGEQMGRFAAAGLGGFVVAPPIAAFLVELAGFAAPFFLLAVALLACLLIIGTTAAPVPHVETRGALRDLLARPAVWRGLLLTAAFYVTTGTVETIWAPFMADLGATTVGIGLSLSGLAIPIIVMARYGGRVVDRAGAVRTGVLALLATTPFLLILGQVRSVVLVALVAGAESACRGVSYPAGQVAVAQAGGPALLASGQGLSGALGSVAAGIAALVSAVLYGRFGAETTWAVLAFAVMVLACLGGALGRGTTHTATRPRNE